MALKKFCPKCGKEIEKFYEGLCKDCFTSIYFEKIKELKKAEIYKCKVCGRYSLTKKQLFNSLDEAINHFVKHSKNLKIKNFQRDFEIQNGFIKIFWKEDSETIFSKDLRIKIKPFKCRYCQMMLSGYRQAIIQIRTKKVENEKILEEILKTIDERNKHDFLSFVSKIERKKSKIDVYIGSKKSAYLAIRRIKSKFPDVDFKIKVSKKLMGYKKGRRLYLDTISISDAYE